MSKYEILTYDALLHNIKYHFNNTVFNNVIPRKGYFVINLNSSSTNPSHYYHITVFQDQWDDYISPSKKVAKLFHITHEITKCSLYLLLTNKLQIEMVNNKDFKYEQPDFSHHSSTRQKCVDDSLNIIINQFQIVINRLANYLYNKYKNKLKDNMPKNKFSIKYYD